MKRFKRALAWLDWSTFAMNGEGGSETSYTFPRNLCGLFWRTVISVVVFPLVWFIHIWNFFYNDNKYNFTNEEANGKLNLLYGMIINMLLMIAFMGAHGITDSWWGIDWYKYSDGIAISYLKIILGAVVVTVVVIGTIGSIVYLCMKWYDHVQERKEIARRELFNDNRDRELAGEDVDWETKVSPLKAFKGKYCPVMEWDFIKPEEE